jgi:hypothetical protein
MAKFIIPIVAVIALLVPAIAQDSYHIRVGDTIYDIRTGSSDNGKVVAGALEVGWRQCGKPW